MRNEGIQSFDKPLPSPFYVDLRTAANVSAFDQAVRQMRLMHELRDTRRGERIEAERVSRTLNYAAHLLIAHGWCRGTARDEKGRMCVGEAISMASSGDVFLRQACVEEMQRRVSGGFPVAWNDAPGRTKEEVISALQSVAHQLHAQFEAA